MRTLLILLLSLGAVAASRGADAVTGRVIKVLPFFLDQQGRNATSPSLFDRDAYQAFLRVHTNQVSALRFDVLWKTTPAADEQIKIDLELRGLSTNNTPKLQTLETNVVAGKYRRWTAVPLAGQDYRDFGAVTAWRVTLWDGGRLLGQQQSFLW
jgi:hypothetical protein